MKLTQKELDELTIGIDNVKDAEISLNLARITFQKQFRTLQKKYKFKDTDEISQETGEISRSKK